MKKLLLSIVTGLFCLSAIAQNNVKQSAYFDGTNFDFTSALIQMYDNSNRKMIVEAWEKQDAPNTHKQSIVYVPAMWTSDTTRPIFDIHIQGTTLSGTYGSNVYVSCPLTFDTNWHHIALIIDTSFSGADSLSLYVDGIYMSNTTYTHYLVTNAYTNNLLIGAQHIHGIPYYNFFKGHIANVVITDSILYTSTFVPDCIFDTTHIIANKCIFPTLIVAPLNTNDNIYDTTGTLLFGTYVIHNNTSPCMPSYTYTETLDSMYLLAINNNASFNKGSYVYHITNGFTGTAVAPIQGTFTDTLAISISDSVIYIDENGDTTKHGAYKSINITGVNIIYNTTHINLYPNPSLGTIYISEPTKIHVIDMTGKCLLNEYVEHSFNLSTGIYICTINDKSYKIVVQ